jgi:cytoskeleton protein RodZ
MSAMTTENTPRDFGHYLQSCRRAKGISLEDVSRITRITVSVLNNIESEDSARLPDPVFVRGFLRAYAQAVGADEAKALARYQAHGKARSLSSQRLAPRQLISGKSIALRLLAGLALFALVIAATLYYAQRETFDETGQAAVKAAPPTETPEAPIAVAPEKVPEFQPGPPETPDAAKSDASAENEQDGKTAGHVLEVTASEPTRLKIIADGRIPQEFHLKSADRIRLEAQRAFSLLIDNAGGVHLVLDGKPVVVPGKSGQVVTIQLP